MKEKNLLTTMKKASAFVLFGLIASLACGCNDDVSSSDDSSSSTTNDHYDAEAFITPTNEVNTTKLVTYDGPALLESSKTVSVKVNDVDLFVYETRVNHGRVFSWAAPTTMTQAVIFDFEGTVHLDVTILETTISSAILRPSVYGIAPSFTEHTISFDLTHSGNYVLEYNDNSDSAIQIFANPIEKDPITKEEADKDDNIIYVGPGIYDAGVFPIKDNTTIYLAGGAYVYGQFSAEAVKNVTIRGRGIVSGSIYSRNSSNEYTIPVVMRSVSNLTIEDIAFFDPAGWALHLWKCQSVKVNNVKIITARSNGDGISVQSCSDVEVSGGYVRTWDDSLVVKNYVDYRNGAEGFTSGIHFSDCLIVIDLAQCMEIGYETIGEKMEGISFSNITVLHAFHKPVMSIHNGNNAKIRNVRYENITVEDASMGKGDGNPYLFDFDVSYSPTWSDNHKKTALGDIDGVDVSNVLVLSGYENPKVKVTGSMETRDGYAKEAHYVKNVHFKNVSIMGKAIDESYVGYINSYAEGITFENLKEATGASYAKPDISNYGNNIERVR